MPELGNDITVEYGPVGGDATGQYYITLDKTFTVREFVERVLNDRGEWGYIDIKLPGMGYFENLGEIEYRYGEIIEGDISKYYDEPIVGISGSGGWSRSDYDLTVEMRKDENV